MPLWQTHVPLVVGSMDVAKGLGADCLMEDSSIRLLPAYEYNAALEIKKITTFHIVMGQFTM